MNKENPRDTLVWALTRLMQAQSMPWWNRHKYRCVRMSRREVGVAMTMWLFSDVGDPADMENVAREAQARFLKESA